MIGAGGRCTAWVGRASCVVARAEPTPAAGLTVWGTRLAAGASVPGGSAMAEAPVSSRATSPVVAKSRPRPTLGIPGSP